MVAVVMRKWMNLEKYYKVRSKELLEELNLRTCGNRRQQGQSLNF
jgi:hypothetical protein